MKHHIHNYRCRNIYGRDDETLVLKYAKRQGAWKMVSNGALDRLLRLW